MEAGKMVKVEGKENDLLERIAKDPAFNMTIEQLQSIMDPANFVGRAVQQTAEFIEEIIKPILDKNKDILGIAGEVTV